MSGPVVVCTVLLWNVGVCSKITFCVWIFAVRVKLCEVEMLVVVFFVVFVLLKVKEIMFCLSLSEGSLTLVDRWLLSHVN